MSRYQDTPPHLTSEILSENSKNSVFFKPKIQLIFPLSPGQILNGYYSLKNIILALIQD